MATQNLIHYKRLTSVVFLLFAFGSAFAGQGNSTSELNCSSAYASPSSLWPVNHKYSKIEIAGITSSRHQQPTVTIQCIRQDEPTNSQGDGSTDVDAKGIGGSRAWLRKERQGGGNGRVYRIDFTASNSDGQSCQGVVTVDVARSRKGRAIDDGPVFDSVDNNINCEGIGNASPVITSEPVKSTSVGSGYQYQVIATDPENDALNYALNIAPDGMSIDTSGLATWTPVTAQVGSHTVDVEVTDAVGNNTQQTFSIEVDDPSQCFAQWEQQSIEETLFNDVGRWSLAGEVSTLTPGAHQLLRLSNDLSQQSSAFYTRAVQIKDDAGNTQDFSAYFEVRLHNTSGYTESDGPGADGVVMVLAPQALPPGDNGGNLGYESFNKSVAIELDTWNNAWDENGNHVGINSLGNVKSIKQKRIRQRINDGHWAYVWVDYTGSNNQLQVRYSKKPERPNRALLTNTMKLPVLLESDTMVVGFTAATGASAQIQDIRSFKLNGVLTSAASCDVETLTFTSVPPVQIQFGNAIDYTAVAESNLDDSIISYELVSSPENSIFNADTGQLQWQSIVTGTVAFEIKAISSTGKTLEQRFELDVLGTPNTAPVANDQSISLNENTSTPVVLIASDAEDDTLVYTIVTAPVLGNLMGDAPNLIYSPFENATGLDEFTYQVSDGLLESNFATISVTVNNLNAVPLAEVQDITVPHDTNATIVLTGTDADGDAISFSIAALPVNGTLDGVPPNMYYIPGTGFAGTDSFSFSVSDATETSLPADVSITVLPAANTAPVASAGEDALIDIGQAIQIQGNGSDPENDPVTLSWSLISKPQGSSVSENSIEQNAFEFVADVVGEYTFQLIVNDGTLFSAPDELIITAVQPNRQPVASAGADQSKERDTVLTLMGSATDPDQNELTFQWIQLSGPETVSFLPDAKNATPHFTPLTSGVYEFELSVSDGKLSSDPDQVQILVVDPIGDNNVPVADAGEDKDVPTNVNVTLVGSGYDIDGDVLSYTWGVLESPVGSQATLTLLFDNIIDFRPDITGTYRLGLTVNDGKIDSLVDIVQIEASTLNTAPIASATFFSRSDQYERRGFLLDASASYDAELGDPSDAEYGDSSYQKLSYTWTVLEPTDPSLYQLDIDTYLDEGNAPDGYSGFMAIDYGIDVIVSVIASDGYLTSEPFLLEIPAGATTPPIIISESVFLGSVGETIALPVNIAEAPDQPNLYNMLPDPEAYQVSWELLSQPELSSSSLTTQTLLIPRVEPANYQDLRYALQDLEYNSLKYTDRVAWQAMYDQLLAEIYGAGGQTSLDLDRPGRYVVKVTADNQRPKGQTFRLIEILAENPGNRQPVARIANSSPLAVVLDTGRVVVELDGLASDDADGDALTYKWTITERPYKSRTYMRESASAVAELVVDRQGTYKVSLVVSDGQRRSEAVELVINAEGTSPNTAPIAVTGTYNEVPSGSRVFLDGYLSTDSEGDPLRYQWRNVSSGAQANAYVYQRNENFSSASVFVNSPGEYVFELIVSDWSLASEPEQVSVTVVPANTAPEADNGYSPGQVVTLKVGEALALNGDRSYDREGATLSYLWSASRLDGDSVLAEEPEASQTTINFTQSGVYAVKLLVSDGDLSDSAWIIVHVFADPNQAPITVFPEVVTADIGETVFLDGTGTYDPDGDRLRINIPRLLKAPRDAELGSVYLFPREVDSIEAVADIKGVYVIAISHTDSLSSSVPAIVKFAVGDPKPVARISAVSQAYTGSEIRLSGTSSKGSNGYQQLSYTLSGTSIKFDWTLISAPMGSTAGLDYPNASKVNVLLDKAGDYEFELQVEDFYATSAPVRHTISVVEPVNSTPIALITGESSVAPGRDLRLDGSLSSDSDGDALTYEWSVVSSPTGSSPLVLVIGTTTIFFSADVAGEYSVQLRVSDQYSTGTAIKTITVDSGTTAIPVADAGSDVNVIAGTPIVLDGTGSSSAENNALEYSWSVLISPQASQWLLEGAETVSPSFSSSQPGSYTLQLVVIDGLQESNPDIVVVTVNAVQPLNSAPIAVAGDDATAEIGLQIALSGSASYDADGDSLSFLWSIVSQPANSIATLTQSDSEIASLIPDVQGTYEIELVVSDGADYSIPDTVSFTVGNSDPIASFGFLPATAINELVEMDASASTDPEGGALTYIWEIESRPLESVANIAGDGPLASFYFDVVGPYIIRLVVTDGVNESAPVRKGLDYNAIDQSFLNVTITYPTTGSLLPQLNTPVVGTYQSDVRNPGIFINDNAVCSENGVFVINELPLTTGLNIVEAELIDQDPSTDTAPIASSFVSFNTEGEQIFLIGMDDYCLSGPGNIDFSLRYRSPNVNTVELDVDNDGVVDYVLSDDSPTAQHYFDSEGLFTVNAIAKEDNKVVAGRNLFVVVKSTEQNRQATARTWNGFLTEFEKNNMEEAISYFAPSSREKYKLWLSSIDQTTKQKMMEAFETFSEIEVKESTAAFGLTVTVNDELTTSIVTFVRDSFGVWKIFSF